MAVDKLVDSTQLDSDLTSVANAIRTKGGTSAQLSFPSGFVSAIEAIPTGGGGTTEDQIFFIDYDGTVVESYTKTEWQSVSALPSNPTHTGLVAQGWNWTKAQIDAQLLAVPDGDVYVGQMYITASGKTEVDVVITDAFKSPCCSVYLDSNAGAIVDWGDGSTPDEISTGYFTKTENIIHNYSATGAYTITIEQTTTAVASLPTVSSRGFICESGTNSTQDKAYGTIVEHVRMGNVGFRGNGDAFSSFPNLKDVTIPRNTEIKSNFLYECFSIKSVTLPDTATTVPASIFYSCRALETVSIPYSVTSIMSNAFNCCGLKSITLPNSVTSLEANVFSSCYNLSKINIPSSVTSLGNNVFSECSSLASITLPNSVTTIGKQLFQNCYALQSVVLSTTLTSLPASVFSGCSSLINITIPSSVTSIGNSGFYNCKSLRSVTIPSTVTSIGTSLFGNCYSLKTVVFLNSPTSFVNSLFNGCRKLESVTIPNTVTSIGSSTFSNCSFLPVITIPSSVTSIGDSGFSTCSSVKKYHVRATTPPTLGNYVFSGIASNCIIYVPYSADHSVLTAYQTAWSDYASYLQEEPQP